VKVSLGLPTDRVDLGDEFVSAEGVAACARAAEQTGFDAVFVTDHPFPERRWLETGGHHTIDPFVALSFAAAATTTLRLHTNLLVLPYRNPFLAAKSIASLDVLSGGRLIVGVGAGYLEGEFDALGASYADRGDRSDEALRAMKAAWAGEYVTFEGTGYEAPGNLSLPRPAQQPHPPIWVGGNSKRAIRRAVELADGWSPMPSSNRAQKRLGTPGMETLDDLRSRVTLMREMAQEAGRTDPLDVVVIPRALSGFGSGAASTEALLDEVGQLAEAGATWLALNLVSDSRAEHLERIEEFATAALGTIAGI
jgi:probable F420-dependent oxidoreductase